MQIVLRECGRLHVVVHNAGHMIFGPAEAFTPDQLAELYDMNVLGTQRVKCAALPVLRLTLVHPVFETDITGLRMAASS